MIGYGLNILTVKYQDNNLLLSAKSGTLVSGIAEDI
jgi:hypothetical protein